MLPVSTKFIDSPNVRSFPDGREIAVFGFPSGADGSPELFVLDLETLRSHALGSGSYRPGTLREPISVSQDGKSVLVQRRYNGAYETVAFPRSGAEPAQKLFSLPGVATPLSQDVAADGSIYMDQPEFQRSVLVTDASGLVKAEILIPKLAEGAEEENEEANVVALPDGAVVFDVKMPGRSVLLIGRAGAEPQQLLNVPASAGLPGSLLGTDKLAFILDTPEKPHIAIASLQDGSVLRRFPADARHVTAITAPADGQTIYYASNGTIWAQPVSGGNPQKIGEGHDVAVEPSGKSLYLVQAGTDGYELFHVSAPGGEATRIHLPANLNLTTMPFSASAVDHHGRILLPVSLIDVFFYRAAIFDPARHTAAAVRVPASIVVKSSGWTPGGDIAARVTRWSSSLWRYRISLQSKGSN